MVSSSYRRSVRSQPRAPCWPPGRYPRSPYRDLVVALLVCWRHRWFCHWVCPTGCCADAPRGWDDVSGGDCGTFRSLDRRWLSSSWPAPVWAIPCCCGWIRGATERCGRHVAWPSCVAEPWGWLGLVLVSVVSLLWPRAWCAALSTWWAAGCTDFGARTPGQNRTAPFARCARATSREWHTLAVPRRTFLGGAVGLAWATYPAHWILRASRPLRPPGSADEGRFSSLMPAVWKLRSRVSRRDYPADTGRYGIGGLWAPLIAFNDDYCWESCNQCTLVCPSGAIAPVVPERKLQAVIGVPLVDMNVCLLVC